MKDELDENNFQKKELPFVSIGLPAFNGEKTLRNALDSIISQTHAKFELVISDNASTDSTETICKEYEKKDKRIRYTRQKKNIGLEKNFYFVLNEAKFDYFKWTAVDDTLLPSFLEKNLQNLMSDKNIVGNMSKIKFYEKRKFSPIKRFIHKIRYKYAKPRGLYSLRGSYHKKVRDLLKTSDARQIYGVFRTEKLRKSIPKEYFFGYEWAVMLNVLKYGDVNVDDEVLVHFSELGMSSTDVIVQAKHFDYGLGQTMFPILPLTNWFIKNIGWKLFFKNLDWFIHLHIWAFLSQISHFTQKR